ncbi:MAG: hypothetical protein KAS93_03955 [Gammaproteobacteria bacterium]|nr:hypothetical protein [Gammaproteobacteria bacterium]
MKSNKINRILIATDQQNCDPEKILSELKHCQYTGATRIDLLYVLPHNAALINDAIPDYSHQDVKNSRRCQQRALNTLRGLGAELNIPKAYQHLSFGSYNHRIRELAQIVNADIIIGYKPSFSEQSLNIAKIVHYLKEITKAAIRKRSKRKQIKIVFRFVPVTKRR